MRTISKDHSVQSELLGQFDREVDIEYRCEPHLVRDSGAVYRKTMGGKACVKLNGHS